MENGQLGLQREIDSLMSTVGHQFSTFCLLHVCFTLQLYVRDCNFYWHSRFLRYIIRPDPSFDGFIGQSND